MPTPHYRAAAINPLLLLTAALHFVVIICRPTASYSPLDHVACLWYYCSLLHAFKRHQVPIVNGINFLLEPSLPCGRHVVLAIEVEANCDCVDEAPAILLKDTGF